MALWQYPNLMVSKTLTPYPISSNLPYFDCFECSSRSVVANHPTTTTNYHPATNTTPTNTWPSYLSLLPPFPCTQLLFLFLYISLQKKKRGPQHSSSSCLLTIAAQSQVVSCATHSWLCMCLRLGSVGYKPNVCPACAMSQAHVFRNDLFCTLGGERSANSPCKFHTVECNI